MAPSPAPPQIRVLLGPMPRILRDVLRHAVDDHPAMTIVGDRDDAGALVDLVALTPVDAVIVSMVGDTLEALCGRLLGARPRVKVLILAPDGRHASLCALQLRPLASDDVSPAGLLDVLRRAVIGAEA